jgi:hypothetical protein
MGVACRLPGPVYPCRCKLRLPICIVQSDCLDLSRMDSRHVIRIERVKSRDDQREGNQPSLYFIISFHLLFSRSIVTLGYLGDIHPSRYQR